jgi:cytochrome c oxidase cbb3-type subunit 2
VKPTPLLFAGIFASFAAAWLGLIVASDNQIGNLQPQVDEENADIYPINVAGIAEQGRRVYVSNGCNYCHTQLVRDASAGADIAREWGSRRTVARDYIYEGGSTIGFMRNGPDLSNIGAPKEETSKRKYVDDAKWHYAHLYNPRSVVPASNMPAFRFLFEKRKISGQRSDDALNLTEADGIEAGYEVVPSNDAKALVAYLRSLDKSHPLSEVKGGTPSPAAK